MIYIQITIKIVRFSLIDSAFQISEKAKKKMKNCHNYLQQNQMAKISLTNMAKDTSRLRFVYFLHIWFSIRNEAATSTPGSFDAI